MTVLAVALPLTILILAAASIAANPPKETPDDRA